MASEELLRVSKLILKRLDDEAAHRLIMDGKPGALFICYQYREDLRKAILEEEARRG